MLRCSPRAEKYRELHDAVGAGSSGARKPARDAPHAFDEREQLLRPYLERRPGRLTVDVPLMEEIAGLQCGLYEPLDPALISNHGMIGPESILASPFHDSGHSCA